MMNTLFSLDALGSPSAFFLALLVGGGFGFALERAGFSSSRRLAGVFYFTDMAVLKVMFTALITALLGLSFLLEVGWIQMDRIFLMPTIYGAQVVAGLLFGVGFVMGGWCPGTAAAGLAAGRMDALVFLIGAIGGSILFNEVFPLIRWLYTAGSQGVVMVYDTLGMSRNGFILLFTAVAVAAFWLAEGAEKWRLGRSPYGGTRFLKIFSLALLTLALGLFVLNPTGSGANTSGSGGAETGALLAMPEQALMEVVDQAKDHIEPEELADRLMAGEPDLVVVDVRPTAEFKAFHIRGALNIPLNRLAEDLQAHKNKGLIVLYSNGMTHPAQARDSLARQGYATVYLLTDGLQGFRDRCLKPVSLRAEPLTASTSARVNAWRAFFLSDSESQISRDGSVVPAEGESIEVPRVVETEWLASKLGLPGVKILDLRSQPEYNSGHIPGSLSLSVESVRGNIGGVPSLLLPPPMLAAQFSLLGLQPSDTVVLVSNDKAHDMTLVGMAFERMGHIRYALLDGGVGKWIQDGHAVDTRLPVVSETRYPVKLDADRFTVDYRAVLAEIGKPGTVIIDVRPKDYFVGKKSDEARAGHIPGAVNRPFTEDVVTTSNKVTTFKSKDALAAAYGQLILAKDTPVIVHCRTGHQASQTFFVLKRILGYSNVHWYDAGWTEWAARLELPVEK